MDIKSILESLDSSLRWNDMCNCYPDFETYPNILPKIIARQISVPMWPAPRLIELYPPEHVQDAAEE